MRGSKMGIARHWELTCDQCRCCENWEGTKAESIKAFKGFGYLFVGPLTFCDADCQHDYDEEHQGTQVLDSVAHVPHC